MNQSQPFIQKLLQWLNLRMAPPGVTILAGTPLFATRMIDSIRILELIAWTERETGCRIPDRMIMMDNFRTAERIAEVFAQEVNNVRK
jgi:hypothetical protein